MTDQKSKLPDFNEISSIAGKFFRDVKTSVNQIIDQYKAKRAADANVATGPVVTPTQPVDLNPRMTPTPEVTPKPVVTPNINSRPDSYTAPEVVPIPDIHEVPKKEP